MSNFINKEVVIKNQIQMQSYYQLPKEILDNAKYMTMKPNALKLYIKLLDLTKLSIKNGQNWIDDIGNFFVKFSQIDSDKKIGMTAPTFRGAKKELIEYGLLYEKKQAKGLPSILYVLLPTSDIETVEEPADVEPQLDQIDTIEPSSEIIPNNDDYTQLEETGKQNDKENLTGGFGVNKTESTKVDSIVPDRKIVYVEEDHKGVIVQAYRYKDGIKEDCFPLIPVYKQKNISDFIQYVKDHQGAVIKSVSKDKKVV
jgi:hypothetical protein